MKNTEEPTPSQSNDPGTPPEHRKSFIPTPLPPWYEWDEPAANALADAAARLVSLSWMMTNAGIAPTELAPLLAMKAVEAQQLDGQTIELLDLYKTERLLTPQTAPHLPHLLAYNHWRLLQIPPKYEPLDTAAMQDLYVRLMTKIVAPEEVRFRTDSQVSPAPLALLPEAGQIPEYLESLSAFIAKAELPHPLVKLAFVYAQLAIFQPFPQANTAFNLLVVDKLLQNERIARLPVLNLARVLRAAGPRYAEHLEAFQLGDGVTDWMRFFFRGLWHAADDAVETLTLYVLFSEQLEERLSVLLGRAIPGGLARFFLSKPAFTHWQFEDRLWLPAEEAGNVLQALLASGTVALTHLPGGEALYYAPDALTFWETMGQEPEVRQ